MNKHICKNLWNIDRNEPVKFVNSAELEIFDQKLTSSKKTMFLPVVRLSLTSSRLLATF